MDVKQVIAFSCFVLAGNIAFAADIDRDDIPAPCLSACDAVSSVTQRCDRDNHNDTAEMNCICNSDQAETRIPYCEACIAHYRSEHPQDQDNDDDDDDDSGPHDNDAYEILTSCGFQTTTYTASSTGAASGSSSTPNPNSLR
ncbi:hypothetical protein BDV18DRAFT_161425 [Aspergillus unguis]